MGQRGVYDQTVAVFHGDVAHMAKLGRLTASLLVKPGIRVGGPYQPNSRRM